MKEKQNSYGVIIYFYFFYGKKIPLSELKHKINDDNYITELENFIKKFENDEFNINEININNSNLLSKEKMEEMKNNLIDKSKKNSSIGESQNSGEATDITATNSNLKIIGTDAGEAKEEDELKKEKMISEKTFIEYMEKMNKKMEEMENRIIETNDACSKKIENITKKIENLNREIMDIKISKFSNNILMSLFSNRDTLKICASTICNYINNKNVLNTLDWKEILEFKRNNKTLGQKIIYGIEVFALLKEIPNSIIHSKHEYGNNLMTINNRRDDFLLVEQNISDQNKRDENDNFISGFQFLIYSNYNAMKTAVKLFIDNKVGNIPQIKYIIKNIVKKKSYLNVKRYINEEGILYYDIINLDFKNIIQYLEENKLSDNINVQLSQVDDFSYQQ